MTLWQAVFALVALLCPVGRCQDGRYEDRYEDLKQEYMEKCRVGRPNVTDLHVYGYQPYMCDYTCYWKNESGKPAEEHRKKDDGVTCIDGTPIGRGPQQCLDGTCVLSSDVAICKDRAPHTGKLKNLVSKECAISCFGVNNYEVQKPEGSPCQLKEDEMRLKLGRCNGFGRCAEVLTYVSDPSGGTEANLEAQEAVTAARHPFGFHFSFLMRYPDPCQFGCMYSTTEIDTPSETLSFEDGYSCGEGMQCLGGQCRKITEIQACQEKLKDDLVEMEYNDCVLICYGKTVEVTLRLPVNSTCYKVLDGWYRSEGVCNAGAKCITAG